jgi:hypothetical protein
MAPKKTGTGFDFKDASKKANATKLKQSALRGKLDGKAGSMGKDTPKPIAKMTDAEKKRRIMSSGQVQEAGLPVGKLVQAAAKLFKSGNIARATDAAARVATKKAGYQLAKEKAMTAKFGRGLVVNTPAGRIGTNAYPKSYGQSGSRSPVSEPYGPKTTSSMNTRIGGRRYVDNRYRYDIKKAK